MTTPTTVQVRFQFRADTAANWTSIDPILLANELGRETDTGRIKIGTGSDAWSSLAYQPWGAQISNSDIAADAEIAVSKLANGTANQILTTDGTNVSWTDSPTIAGNVIISGNLTVNGTETVINVETLQVEDHQIEIGNVTTPTDLTADGGGIVLLGATNKTILWVDSTDSWTSSENVDLASGKTYKIAGTDVLSATTLGSAVQISSDNIPAGTVTNDDLAGSIADSKLNTISTAGKVSNSATTATDANTASAIVARDASGNFSAGTITADLAGNASTVTTNADLTGDVTSVGNTTSIAAGAIVDADVNASAAIAGTKIDADFGAQDLTVDTDTLVVDATNDRVGIGVASPATDLHIQGAGASVIRLENGNGVAYTDIRQNQTGEYLEISPSSSSNQSFVVNRPDGSEALRIDSSGRLLVGTSSTSADTLQVIEGRSGASTGNGVLLLARGSTPNNGNPIGTINFSDSGHTTAAEIEAARDGGTWTTGASQPTRLVFSTTADGASSPTERMRIDSSGVTTFSFATIQSLGTFIGTVTNNKRIDDASIGTGSDTLYIGNAAIQVSSDVRLKENIEDTQLDALDAISQIKVKDFTWNDPSDTSHNNRNARGKWTGLIAQELVKVLPFVVNAPRKEEDGSIDYESEDRWILDQSQLCPVLIKAVQQQQEIIALLEARLSALEAQ